MSERIAFEFNGHTFNAVDHDLLDDATFYIESVQGRDPLTGTVDLVSVDGGDGGRLRSVTLPERVIEVGVTVAAEDQAGLRRAMRQLSSRLRTRGLSSVSFSDQDDLFYIAQASYSEDSASARFTRGTITFTCPQPFAYGPERTVTLDGGGTVEVESDYFVEPVIVWTTDAAVGAAWIEVDGTRLTIDTGVAAGQQIRIDSSRKEVRRGGVLDVENVGLPGEEFPRLFDGSVVEASPGGELVITYRERWT